jgi:hypothetical protein
MEAHDLVFLREFEASVDFPGEARVYEFEVCDPSAYVVHVSLSAEFNEFGRLGREYLLYAVKDRGIVSHVTGTKSIVVVRRVRGITPLRSDCGKLLGFLRARVGQFEYYVFEGRDGPATRSTPEETTSPPRATASSNGGSQRDPEACSCVFDGPTEHESGTRPILQTGAKEEPLDDWGFPSEPKASGG